MACYAKTVFALTVLRLADMYIYLGRLTPLRLLGRIVVTQRCELNEKLDTWVIVCPLFLVDGMVQAYWVLLTGKYMKRESSRRCTKSQT